MLTLAYVALIVLGCGYIVGSMFLGHGSDGGGHDVGHDGGGHGIQTAYGVDSSGHASSTAGDGASAAFHFPFFSPLALSTLFACVGAFGLVAKAGFRLADDASLLVAVPAAAVTAYVVTYVGWRVSHGAVGTSQIRMEQITGAEGEVITPIPEGGLGEVALIVDGQRFTSAARDEAGGPVARGACVRVVRMTGQTLVVTTGAKEGRR